MVRPGIGCSSSANNSNDDVQRGGSDQNSGPLATDEVEDPVSFLAELLLDWDMKHRNSDFDATKLLKQICEMVEKEAELYLKQDPDPLDDRHPNRINPDSNYGTFLKDITKDSDFMNYVLGNYFASRDNPDLNMLSCRLLLNLVAGLELHNIIRDHEDMVPTLYRWAESGKEPLMSYSTGLLGSILEISNADDMSVYKKYNDHLVPILVARLIRLQRAMVNGSSGSGESSNGSGVCESSSVSTRANMAPVLTPSVNNRDGGAASSTLKNHPPTDFTELMSSNGGGGIGEKTVLSNCTNGPSTSGLSDVASRPNINKNPVPVLKVPRTPRCEAPIKGSGSEPVQELMEETVTQSQGKKTKRKSSGGPMCSTPKRVKFDKEVLPTESTSNSSWAEIEPFLIGKHKIYPLSNVMQQRFILQFLAAIAQYQDVRTEIGGLTGASCENTRRLFEERIIFRMPRVVERRQVRYYLVTTLATETFSQPLVTIHLSFAYPSEANSRHNVMDLIFYYIDLEKGKDVRLAFDALRYLAALLVHKKFALDFVSREGVSKLLKVYKHSMASVGVAICFYHMVYNDDVLEQVCHLPPGSLEELIRYALWLVEHSYESAKSHVVMFFTYALRCKCILDLFDQYDGLRRLYNMVSTLRLIQMEDGDESILMTDDQMDASRDAIKFVCGAFCSYFLTHMFVKVDNLKKRVQQLFPRGVPPLVPNRSIKMDLQSFEDYMPVLVDSLPMYVTLKPAEDFIALGGLALMFKVLGVIPEWSYGGGKDIVCSILDILWLLSCLPRVQMEFLEYVELRRDTLATGMKIIISTCEGDAIELPEAQLAALNILINCVCGSEKRPGVALPRFLGGVPSANWKKYDSVSACQLLQKMWKSVRSNDGLMILRDLLSTKTPAQTADAIRARACKALVGLARCPEARQILSKMPLIENNQLHVLMREPALQDKRSAHKMFREQAKLLIERVTGQGMSNVMLDVEKHMKMAVVGQTKIVYNSAELLQLIYNHLTNQGFSKTASALVEEAQVQHRRLPSNTFNSPLRTLPSRFAQPRGASDDSIERSPFRVLAASQSGMAAHSVHKFGGITSSLDTPKIPSTPSGTPGAVRRLSIGRRKGPIEKMDLIFPVGGGSDGIRCDLRHVFSKYKAFRPCRMPDIDEIFTCCSFSDDQLLLTSSAFTRPRSGLWKVRSRLHCDSLYNFNDDSYVEFSKCPQDRIVGTRGAAANIYDVSTGQCVLTLADKDMACHYTQNRATFHPRDELVLSDGLLWDIRSQKIVHKFDKLNPHISGQFHPCGLEVLINQEVWDIRNFQLLKSVSELDQCKVTFNKTGTVIFGTTHIPADELDLNETRVHGNLGTTFRTFDARTYDLISTTDVRKNILDLCIDRNDSYLALIEVEGIVEDMLSLKDNMCRLYEVGRERVDDNEVDDGEDENEEDSESDDDDDDDDDDSDVDAEPIDSGSEGEDDDEDEDGEGDESANALASESSDDNEDDEDYDPPADPDGDDDDENGNGSDSSGDPIDYLLAG